MQCLLHCVSLCACVRLACLSGNLLVLFQSVLEELASLEIQLSRLKEKAQLLWDEHAAGKGFVHRVSQLSAQYLALTNLTKVQSSARALTGALLWGLELERRQ